jgi:hypothetical protein
MTSTSLFSTFNSLSSHCSNRKIKPQQTYLCHKACTAAVQTERENSSYRESEKPREERYEMSEEREGERCWASEEDLRSVMFNGEREERERRSEE